MRRAIALLVLTLATACTPLRGLETLDLLLALEGAPPDRPVARPVHYQGRSAPRAADLYRADAGPDPASDPASDPAPGLVLVPGLTPAGKDDPRLIGFARQLARAGFTVLVPEIANLRALRADPDDAVPIAEALGYLADVTGGAVGLGAFSYGAGPAVLAALREDVAGRLGFLLLVGGYHDAEAAIGFVATGAFRTAPDAPWQRRPPDPRALWAFVGGNADRIDDSRDRTALKAMAARRRRDPAAPIGDLAADLGGEGRAVLDLVENRDPERVAVLVAALPAAIRADVAALDLKRRDLGRLEVPVILVHGRDDPVIPHSESIALARAFPEERVDLHLVESLQHVELGALGPGDGLTLFRAAYRLLEARDALAKSR